MTNRQYDLKNDGVKSYAATFRIAPQIPDAFVKYGKRKMGKIEIINQKVAILHYQNQMYPLTVTSDFTREKQHHLYTKKNNVLHKTGHVYHKMEFGDGPVDQKYVNKLKKENRDAPRYFVNTSGERKRKREIVLPPSKKPKVSKPALSRDLKTKPRSSDLKTNPKSSDPPRTSKKRQETKHITIPEGLKELIILLLANELQSTGHLRHKLEKRGEKINPEQFRFCLDEIADVSGITKQCTLKSAIFESITRARIHNCAHLTRQETRYLLTKITQREEEKKKKIQPAGPELSNKKRPSLQSGTEIRDADTLRKQEAAFEEKRQMYNGYQAQITRVSKKFYAFDEEWKNAKTTAAKGAARSKIYTAYANDRTKLRSWKRDCEKLLKEMQELKLQINIFYSKMNS